MQTEILPIVCGISPEFVSHLLSENLLGNRELFQSVIQGELPSGTASVEQLFERSTPPPSPLYALALARLEWARQEELFIDRPNLFTRHLYAVPSANEIALRDAIDIVANEIGVALTVRDPFAARVAQGVLDTNAESLLRPDAVTLGNAGDGFAASHDWTAVRSPQNAAMLAKLALPNDLRRQIADDLAVGYSAVAPDSALSTQREPFVGWWRINSATGDVLGIGPNGWGQTATEERSLLVRVVNLANRWNLLGRAVTFAVTAAQDYGWCVTPLIVRYSEDVAAKSKENWAKDPNRPVLGASLAIWEGAVKPSWRDCGGNAIWVGGVTAILLPTRILKISLLAPGARRIGGSPKAPELEPPAPKPPCEEPAPPKAPPSRPNPLRNRSPYTYGREEWYPGDYDPDLPAPKAYNTSPAGNPIDYSQEWGRFPHKQGYVEYEAAQAVQSRMAAEKTFEEASQRLSAAAEANRQAYDAWEAALKTNKPLEQIGAEEATRLEQTRAELNAAEGQETIAQMQYAKARRWDDYWDRLKPVNREAVQKFKRMIELRDRIESQTGKSASCVENSQTELGKEYEAARKDFQDYYPEWKQAATDYETPATQPTQSGKTLPPIAPPAGTPPPGSPTGPTLGSPPPGAASGPPPGTNPPGPGSTLPLSPGGPPPGTTPPGTSPAGAVDPFAKTVAGWTSAAGALKNP